MRTQSTRLAQRSERNALETWAPRLSLTKAPKARCAAFHRQALRRLPTRCCEVAGRVARAPRVVFGPFRSRKPARAFLCAVHLLCRDAGFCMMPGWFAGWAEHLCAQCCCACGCDGLLGFMMLTGCN